MAGFEVENRCACDLKNCRVCIHMYTYLARSSFMTVETMKLVGGHPRAFCFRAADTKGGRFQDDGILICRGPGICGLKNSFATPNSIATPSKDHRLSHLRYYSRANWLRPSCTYISQLEILKRFVGKNVSSAVHAKAAGLEVVADVMESQCLLIVGKDTKHRAMVDLIVRRIEGYITAEK